MYSEETDEVIDYGKELPDHFQDPMTQDILKSIKMSPKEVLKLAIEEEKRNEQEKIEGKKKWGPSMYTLRRIYKGRQAVDQSERGANLYDRYTRRNITHKRLTPSEVDDMINDVNISRGNFGGRKRRKTRRNRRRKTRKIVKKRT